MKTDQETNSGSHAGRRQAEGVMGTQRQGPGSAWHESLSHRVMVIYILRFSPALSYNLIEATNLTQF